MTWCEYAAKQFRRAREPAATPRRPPAVRIARAARRGDRTAKRRRRRPGPRARGSGGRQVPPPAGKQTAQLLSTSGRLRLSRGPRVRSPGRQRHSDVHAVRDLGASVVERTHTRHPSPRRSSISAWTSAISRRSLGSAATRAASAAAISSFRRRASPISAARIAWERLSPLRIRYWRARAASSSSRSEIARSAICINVSHL
jgi:hypothetical protein